MDEADFKEVVALYENRQNRLVSPHGRFNEAGHWYPYPEELCGCCVTVIDVCEAEPYVMLRHCRSLEHCKQLIIKQKGG